MKQSLYYTVPGARRLSNYIWGAILTIGGIGFLLTGLSCYFNFALLPFIKIDTIQFFPQGLVMCFYGVLAISLSIYIWLIILWDLGQGFNEFNTETGEIRIFRWGFPGKNRRIDLKYLIRELSSTINDYFSKDNISFYHIFLLKISINEAVFFNFSFKENCLFVQTRYREIQKRKKNLVGIF